ncbi:MAG: MFS transporter [Actinobacteria bacterium]|nr:MFS transporter [Actinomycetota bacterium]
MTDARPPRGPLVALGVLSIVAFGGWFYGFGVLLEPIRQDTGWAETTLTSTYGASLFLTGLGAAVGGAVIDRRGGRTLLVGAGVLAGAALVATSFATSPAAFAVAGAVAGGTIGAGGYYHATQAIIGRLAPEARTRGMTALTLWGAFASPVFLPLLGWTVTAYGWRPTVRGLAVAVAFAFLAAAATIPADRVDRDATGRPSAFAALRRTADDRVVGRLYLSGLAAGIGTSVLLLYQVPAMVAAGLSLGVASSLAGARGVVQLGGRIPLPPVVRRFGSYLALRVSLVLAAVGALLLPFAGDLPTAVTFTAVAGVAIGALAALEGIYAGDVTAHEVLGTTLGAYSLVRGIGSAVGPVLGGLLADAVGSRGPTLALSAVALVTAALVLRRPQAEGPADQSVAWPDPVAGTGP